jgi:hypothetical protein|tara:strand:+ start:29 stop:286 length:258 start_codon:yes stop_codon:yes gene_type:complete
MSVHISEADKVRLKHLVSEGVRVKQEVESLNEGLKETVKAIAEELEIKPALLNKAIRIAYKGDLQIHANELEDVETILDAIGMRL